jgi:hypothetical protein
MSGTTVRSVPRVLLILLVLGGVLSSFVVCIHAEPALLVYPSTVATFRYDPARYQLLLPSDPNYDPAYSVGGSVLWDKVEQRIPVEVYRAPNLVGFEPSADGRNEFVTMSNDFYLIVDGFFHCPRQLSNLYVRFIPDPPQSTALIIMNGQPIDYYIEPIPGFAVSTPVGDGWYADTQQFRVRWSAATGIRITAWGDKDGDGIYSDGKPLFGVYVRDNSVPVKTKTWGGVKSLYAGD